MIFGRPHFPKNGDGGGGARVPYERVTAEQNFRLFGRSFGAQRREITWFRLETNLSGRSFGLSVKH